MTTVLKMATDVYNEILESRDPRAASWFLMASPVPTLIIVGVYVAFVKVIGPAWMRERKSFDLRKTMFLYNMCLLVASIYLIVKGSKALILAGKGFGCKVNDVDDPNTLKLYEVLWLYYILKVVECIDTVFFVLRKKFQHITTLHVFHHSVMVACTWPLSSLEPGSYVYFTPLINTTVHVFMYGYYGLAALGPRAKRFLWWKRYLTILQMMQFLAVIIYFASLSLMDCKVPTLVLSGNYFLAVVFLYMFYHYFKETYVKKKKL